MANDHRDTVRIAASNMLEAAKSACPAMSNAVDSYRDRTEDIRDCICIWKEKTGEPCSTSKLLRWIKVTASSAMHFTIQALQILEPVTLVRWSRIASHARRCSVAARVLPHGRNIFVCCALILGLLVALPHPQQAQGLWLTQFRSSTACGLLRQAASKKLPKTAYIFKKNGQDSVYIYI